MSRKILITGANSGIGFYLALSLLENGDKVAVLDVQTMKISKLSEKFGAKLLVFDCDITDEKLVFEIIEQIHELWGSIDIVVNNACKAIFKPFQQNTAWDIEEAFRVNVFGMLNVIRAVLPGMVKANKGLIHNVSSGVGITGFSKLLGYASSKGAVETLTRCLAIEYAGTDIFFNIIHPPLTATPSANPIGLPARMLEDPEKTGRKLSKKIGSRKVVITAGWKSWLGLKMMKLFPYFMGRLFSKLTAKNQNISES